jgi:hypothetical protein
LTVSGRWRYNLSATQIRSGGRGAIAALVAVLAAAAASGGSAEAVSLPPPPSSVTSVQYPNDGSFHGGVGRTGQFVIHPPATGAGAIVSYLVGFNRNNQPSSATPVPADPTDHSATVALTPDLDGPNVILVWSRDASGNLSDVINPLSYDFLVRPATAPAALWTMDESGGTSLLDASGHGNTATIGGGATRAPSRVGNGSALLLDGDGQDAVTATGITTVDPDSAQVVPVRTDHSFSIAAWVLLDTADATRAAVSVAGPEHSRVTLEYSGRANRWAFVVAQTGGRAVRVLSTEVPAPGVWTHLAGTFDLAKHQLTLYVDGRPQGTAVNPQPANAAGPVAIGSAERGGHQDRFWRGKVDDVRVWDRLVFGPELAALVNTAVLAGRWALDEGTGTVAADSAGLPPAHPGTLEGGASWSPVDPADANLDTGALPPGAVALTLDGSTGFVDTGSPVVMTDQGFSAAAWVRLTDTTADHAVIAQEGLHASAFAIVFSHTLGQWTLIATSADTDAPVVTQVVGPGLAAVGTWTHLAAVYDLVNHKLCLVVDGFNNACVPFTASWNATGSLVIGRERVASAPTAIWAGDIAEARVYAGALTASDIAGLAFG